MIRTYWRVPLVAVLGAVLAFLSSYLVSTTYQSSTRLIIHGRDANLLSSSGQQDNSQPTITDTDTAKALSDTYGSIATSRALAITVVDDLHLDAPSTSTGFLHDAESVFATVYRCGRAFITTGGCPSVSRREKAIGDVQTGTTALQLGTTAGNSAGQAGSYVMELTTSGDSPEKAQAIANTLANQLVVSSSRLAAQDAAAYITKLKANLTVVNDAVASASTAVTGYETAHDVSAADQQLAVTASAYSDLQADLRDAHNDLVSAQAKLRSVDTSLTHTARTTSSGQTINTGRSDTSITMRQTNPTYSDLVTAKSQTQADISGLQARISSLTTQVGSSSPSSLNGPLAALANLQEDLNNERRSQSDVLAQLRTAQTASATAQPDLSRIDVAGRPTYPTSPKRYLYLLIGLLLGALAGGGLTWRAGRRIDTDLPDGAGVGDGHPGAGYLDDGHGYDGGYARDTAVEDADTARHAHPERVDAMALLGVGPGADPTTPSSNGHGSRPVTDGPSDEHQGAP